MPGPSNAINRHDFNLGVSTVNSPKRTEEASTVNAQDMHRDDGEIKTERRPYFPFYGDDWTGGTIGFTLEQEGFFLRFVKCQWARKADLRDDIKWLAAALHCDPRTVRRLRQFLLDTGKIKIAENGMLYNARMRSEIAKDQAKIDGRSGKDRPKIARRFAGSTPKKPTKTVLGPLGSLPPEPEPDPDQRDPDPVLPVARAEKDDHERVRFSDGKIELFNGLRAFWLEEFEGDEKRLELGLIQAAGFIQPNNPVKPLEAQVGAQLARQCSEKRDRDKRYAQAAQSKAASKTSTEIDQLPAWRRDQARRNAEAKAWMDQHYGKQETVQ